MSKLNIFLTIDSDDLAEELAENVPATRLLDLIKYIDMYMADSDFTFDLLDILAESLSDEGFKITISATEENK